jgi:hypothetical protein
MNMGLSEANSALSGATQNNHYAELGIMAIFIAKNNPDQFWPGLLFRL